MAVKVTLTGYREKTIDDGARFEKDDSNDAYVIYNSDGKAIASFERLAVESVEIVATSDKKFPGGIETK